MNTINCRVKTNDFSDSAGVDITPAEVIVLRTIHDKHAGGCCIIKARPAGQAMTEVGRKPVVLKLKDVDGNEVEIKTTEPVLRPRTDAEELIRLRGKYSARAASGAPKSHICDDLFGGAGVVAKLPQTFAELPDKFKTGLVIEIPRPDAGNAALLDGNKPEPEAPAETEQRPRDMLLAKSKVELVEIGKEYGLEKPETQTKAALIDAIMAKAGYGEPSK